MTSAMTDFIVGETFYLACLDSPSNPVPQARFVEYLRDAGSSNGERTVRIVDCGTGRERTVFVRDIYKIKAEAMARASKMKP